MVFQRGTVVKIIPWFHHFQSKLHEDAMRYVRRLPRQSFLAIESSYPSLLHAIGRIEKLEASDPAEKRKARLITGQLDKDYWAVLEAIHECRKRDIRAISIDVADSLYLHETYGEVYAYNAREHAMETQILDALKKHKPQTFYVLADAVHALALKEKLRQRSIVCRIQTRFSGRNLVKKYLERRSAWRGKWHLSDAAIMRECRKDDKELGKVLRAEKKPEQRILQELVGRGRRI